MTHDITFGTQTQKSPFSAVKTELVETDMFESEIDGIESLLAENKVEEAELRLDTLLEAYPNNYKVNFFSGHFYEKLNRQGLAYEFFKRSVEINPDSFDAWLKFGHCLFTLAHFEAALIAFERVIKINPQIPDYHVFLGNTFGKLDRKQDALVAYDNALVLEPDHIGALFQKALLYQIWGETDEAKYYFDKVLKIKPNTIEVYYQLSQMSETSDNLEQIQEQLTSQINSGCLSPEANSIAYFTLGRLFEKNDRYDDAFASYSAGNNLISEKNQINFSFYEDLVHQTMEGYSAETFQRLKSASHHSDTPIFILGMMRSGTTLVEQILSRHHDIASAGEILKIAKTAESLIRIKSGAFQYPRDISLLSPSVLSSFADDYIDHLNRFNPEEKKFVTDKLPFNFFHIGLIKILFPNAKVIHCVRHPIDTCLSCYFQRFTEPGAQSFSTNLESLAKFYKLYQKLMEYWHSILPGEITDIHYEEIVDNPENTTRKMLSDLNLEFDADCLTPEKNQRSIKTASRPQVQQPIYKTSMHRWKHYDKHLGILKDHFG